MKSIKIVFLDTGYNFIHEDGRIAIHAIPPTEKDQIRMLEKICELVMERKMYVVENPYVRKSE